MTTLNMDLVIHKFVAEGYAIDNSSMAMMMVA